MALCLAPWTAAQDSHSTAAQSPLPVVTVTDQDNGRDVELPQGSTLLVKLNSNPSTGYSWSVKGDPSPLKLQKKSFRQPKQQKPGAPGMQEFRFTSASAGMVMLTLEYRRPWEHEAAAARTFQVHVMAR